MTLEAKHYRGTHQWEFYGNVKLGSAGGLVGLYGVTPAVQPVGYGTPTSLSKVASLPGTSATLAQVGGTLAALIADLQKNGYIGA